MDESTLDPGNLVKVLTGENKALLQRVASLEAEALRREEDRRRTEGSLLHMNRLYATRSQIIRTVVDARDRDTLFREICRVAIDHGRFRMAWIGLMVDADATVRPVAMAGQELGYLDHIAIAVHDPRMGLGPTGAAIRDGHCVICQDIASDPRMAPWREQALRRDFRSSAAVPIRVQGCPVGALTVYSDQAGAFSDQDEELLEEIGKDISHALDAMNAEVERERLAGQALALEAQLLQAQKMEGIGRLAGGVAHDFNNLLSVILNYADYSLDHLPDDSPVREDLREIIHAGERAARLTRQLLAFCRKQLMQPKSLDLNQVVAEMEKMLRRIIGEDIVLEQVLGPDLGRTRADPGQIEQVIMNLVVNARDAMPAGGRLTIETANVELGPDLAELHPGTEPGPHVMLAITDSGCGMDGPTKARVFEPFFTTKEHGKGTGLGLSTVYGIVTQSGGSIYLYSEPGRGTTFKVYLPRETKEEHPAAAGPPVAPRANTGGETILLVEDEDALRKVVKRALEAAGYTVLTAADGEEALKVSAREAGPIQLLLTDVVLPKLGGRRLAAELAKNRPETRVLFTSGYTDNAIVAHGVLDPGTNYLAKPFIASDLVRKVDEILA